MVNLKFKVKSGIIVVIAYFPACGGVSSRGGERYQKTFTYAYFRETSSKSRQANVFDSTYILGAGKNLDLRMIFPIGSPMTVFYNPVDPQIGFVERYAGLVGFYKIGMILTVGIYLVLLCILILVF